MDVDEDDAFLYGSDAENATGVAKAAENTPVEAAEREEQEEEDDDAYDVPLPHVASNEDMDEEVRIARPAPDIASNTQAADDNDAVTYNDNGDDDDDSDSDVEFIIGSLESKTPAIKFASDNAEVEDSAAASIEPSDPVTPGLTDHQLGAEATETASGTIRIATVPILTPTDGVGLDINKVGLYNDIPVTEITLDELQEKPWRLPGAEVSDYFNYGFDELSWRAYCAKHEQLAIDYNPGKVMNEMLAARGGGAGSVMGMPGFMGMPGMMGGRMNNNNGNNNNNNNSNNGPGNSKSNNNGQGGPRDSRDLADRDMEKNAERRDRDRERDRRDRDRDRDRERDRERDRDRDRDRELDHERERERPRGGRRRRRR